MSVQFMTAFPKVCLVENNGKKIAFSAFNDIHDHPENSFIASLEREILFNTLDSIKKESPDYIIFSFHWGNEYVPYPSPSQVSLAHELIDSGVNIIIGHHPHVVQPVEKYHGGIILYSLGNFLFDMLWSGKVRTGIQADLILNEDRTIDVHIRPFYLTSDFTQDYSSSKAISESLEKAGQKLKLLKSGPKDLYERTYLNECKKRRLMARIQMKLFLLKNVFNLSAESRGYLYKNLKLKSGLFWKRR